MPQKDVGPGVLGDPSISVQPSWDVAVTRSLTAARHHSVPVLTCDQEGKEVGVTPEPCTPLRRSQDT